MTPLGADLLILSGMDLAFGPKRESRVFLSAEGEAYTSLGQRPRKMEQRFGQG